MIVLSSSGTHLLDGDVYYCVRPHAGLMVGDGREPSHSCINFMYQAFIGKYETS